MHSSDDPYITCDHFYNVEKYTTVIWTCQHMISAFKKIFEILT